MTKDLLAPSPAAVEVTAPARDVRYDLLRITAAFMVVLLHTAGAKWSAVPYNSFDWAVLNVYDSLVRSAVPLFFMLSGAFLLKKEIPLKRLWLKKILPLLLIYAVWSILYAVDAIGLTSLFKTPFSEFLLSATRGSYHLWFLPTLIGLYILQPILHAFTRFADGKYVPYLISCFVIFRIVRETLFAFFGAHESLSLLLTKIPVECTEYAGYILLGYYLANQKRIRVKPAVALTAFFGTAFLAAACGQLHSHLIGTASDILYSSYTLPVFAEAVLLFLCFSNIRPKRIAHSKASAAIEKASALTLGIYLIHPFILTHLEQNLHISPLSFTPVLSVPVIAILAALLSGGITFVMLKIPVVKRIFKL